MRIKAAISLAIVCCSLASCATKKPPPAVAQNPSEATPPKTGALKTESHLSIADVIVSEYTYKLRPEFPELMTTDAAATLDFRLHNSGNASVSISRLRLVLVDVSERTQTGQLGGNDILSSTATYDTDLSTLKKPGDLVEFEVSHLISKDSADRFKVVATAKERFFTKKDRTTSWKLRPILVTSQGEVTGPEIVVAIPAPRRQ